MSHYKIISIKSEDAMNFIRNIFPDAKPDCMNLIVFSTSGVHGTYNTIEEAEACIGRTDEDAVHDVTFTIYHPRLVCLKYGVVEIKTGEDAAFLKLLRERSWAELLNIGRNS